MTRKIQITEVPNWEALQKTRTLVFNRYQVRVYGITGKAHDTEFSYFIYTEQKLTKTQISILQNYIDGIVDTLRSF